MTEERRGVSAGHGSAEVAFERRGGGVCTHPQTHTLTHPQTHTLTPNPVENHAPSDSRPFVVPSPTLRPLRPLREIISRQARQARQEDIGLGAFSCLPFRVFRVFRSSLPPLGVAASAQFQISNFKFQVSSFKFPLPIRVHSWFFPSAIRVFGLASIN